MAFVLTDCLFSCLASACWHILEYVEFGTSSLAIVMFYFYFIQLDYFWLKITETCPGHVSQ